MSGLGPLARGIRGGRGAFYKNLYGRGAFVGGGRQISAVAREAPAPKDDILSSSSAMLGSVDGKKEDLLQILRNINDDQYQRYFELKGNPSHLDELTRIRCLGFWDVSVVNGSNTAGSICAPDESEAQGATISDWLSLISFQ